MARRWSPPLFGADENAAAVAPATLVQMERTAEPVFADVAPVVVGGAELRPTVVFDAYWKFASARQDVYRRRLRREPPPWTDDDVIARHRFTNAYRASDRVSQRLIAVQQDGPQDAENLVFRTLLFKMFNKIDTWDALSDRVGDPDWRTYDFDTYRSVLDDLIARRRTVYSAAYITPPPNFGETRKHANHLRLIEHMMRDGVVDKLSGAASMRDAYGVLRGYPTLGRFLAFQYLTDLNYSRLLDFDEDDFVVAGPGAADGVRKCFVGSAGVDEAKVVRHMVETQEENFARLGLRFLDLWGRPLKLIDCQNLFCEVDKYARVAHPTVSGVSGRTRIKQIFAPAGPLPRPRFPEKWNLDGQIAADLDSAMADGCDTLF